SELRLPNSIDATSTRSPSPKLSYGALRLLPFWDPLRGDPRFEQIVASFAPKKGLVASEVRDSETEERLPSLYWLRELRMTTRGQIMKTVLKFCVTHCVTRIRKNGQITDYA